MIVAIHQPNYIPWLGYFAKIMECDFFVFLDDVQYPKESPAARNYILDVNNTKALLSVPVKIGADAFQNYNKIAIDYSANWQHKHLNKIKNSYCKAPYFADVFEGLEKLYKQKYENLAQLNLNIIFWILNMLDCSTQLYLSSNIEIENIGASNERNVNLCKYFNANIYLSGTGAKKYNDEKLYQQNNIQLKYQNFKHPVYKQYSECFVQNLSILDILFFGGAQQTKNYLLNSFV